MHKNDLIFQYVNQNISKGKNESHNYFVLFKKKDNPFCFRIIFLKSVNFHNDSNNNGSCLLCASDVFSFMGRYILWFK